MPAHSKRQHNSVYAFIGQRIKERRKLLQLNQTQLAELMGFSYQQMQKYETGASHVTAGKLLLFAKVLNVPPGYFYDGITLDETIGKRIENHIIQKIRTEPLHVLLVDDSPADVIAFRKAISTCSEQVSVHTIHNAQDVMDFLLHHDVKFGQKSIDLVVLELLPKSLGIELLKSLKKNPKTQILPVVVLTSSIHVKDMMDAYKHGAASFIQKSVDLHEYAQSMEVIMKYWSKIVAMPSV